MKEAVRLKSFPNGIKIVIEEDASLDEVKKEVAEKFRDSEKFFGKAKLAVSFEGRKNTTEEEDEILDAIANASKVNIVCVASKEPDKDLERALGCVKDLLEGDVAQFYRGDLNGKQVLETEQNIIILGNVNKGSSIISKKDIIVLGSLQGSAYAGADGQNHFVAALSMEPEAIRIGEKKGKYKSSRGGLLGRKKTTSAQIAYLKEEEIVFDDLTFTEELLQNLY